MKICHTKYCIKIPVLFLFFGSLINAQTTDTIKVEAGWNLISLPLIVTDSSVGALFHNSVSNAFYYDGSYKPSDTLEVGKGYWLKYNDADTVLIAGSQIIKNYPALNAGWNIIGTITQACCAREIITSPADIITSEFYKWNNESGYFVVDSLFPWEAYWVKCSSPGLLIMESGSTGPELVAPANWSEGVNTALLLQWKPMVNAMSYHLQVSKDPFFLKMTYVDDPTISDTLKKLCDIEFGEIFYWRVRAVYPDSTGEWSVTWTFRTISMPQPIADSLALFMYVGGEPAGWYLLDPNTLEPVDSILFSDNTWQFVYRKKPIEFSTDGSIWYTVIPGPYPQADTLVAIHAVTKDRILRTLSGGYPVMDKDKRYIVLVNYGLIFLDRNTFSSVIEIPFDQFNQCNIIRTSPVSQTLYGVGNKEIGVFDIDSFRVDKIIQINDACIGWGPTDMEISEDGTNLFLSVDTDYNDCPSGKFYHVDLIHDSVVAALPCGKYAQIGVSPDNKYVYLSNPRNIYGEPFEIGKYMRYNVESKTMEVDIELFHYPGLLYDGIAEQIIVSPDSGALFIAGGGITCEGIHTRLTKIDIATKEVLKTFDFKPNQQGHITQSIRGIKFGKLFKQ